MKTGNTPEGAKDYVRVKLPQWSPVMKTGNTSTTTHDNLLSHASMEPGHEDREYAPQPSPSSRASTSLNGARS